MTTPTAAPEDGLRLQMEQVTAARASAPSRAYQDSSKRRLEAVLRRKVTTAFIGAIAIFEKKFGHLWGHGRPAAALTEVEREWRSLWEQCRTEALDKGNAQVRAVHNELSEYTVTWNRHRLVLPAVQAPQENAQ